MGVLNRVAGTRPIERAGFAVAAACFAIVVIWISIEQPYDIGRGIQKALVAAWPGSWASREVPVSWACTGFFIGLALRFLARPLSRWVLNKPSPSESSDETRPKRTATTIASTKAGVGGWLALLVAGMLVLGPLAAVGRLLIDIEDTERIYPTLIGLPVWADYKAWLWGITGAAVLINMTAGLRLLKGRDVAVVTFAKVALWTSGPVASIAVGWLLPLAKFGAKAVPPETIAAVIGSAIVASLWTLYLSKSQRVRNTYNQRPVARMVVL